MLYYLFMNYLYLYSKYSFGSSFQFVNQLFILLAHFSKEQIMMTVLLYCKLLYFRQLHFHYFYSAIYLFREATAESLQTVLFATHFYFTYIDILISFYLVAFLN